MPKSYNPVKLPPTYFLLAVFIQFFLAWQFPGPVLDAGRALLGGILILVGIAYILGAFWEFGKHRTSVFPFQTPTALLTRGVYRLSRNPIYAGEALLLVGLAVIHGTPWALLPVPAFMGVIHFGFIRPEERILRNSFGKAFEEYRQQTRPWF